MPGADPPHPRSTVRADGSQLPASHRLWEAASLGGRRPQRAGHFAVLPGQGCAVNRSPSQFGEKKPVP